MSTIINYLNLGQNMSDQLMAVIVGALIASLMPALTLLFEYKKWKREKKLEFYKEESERIEKLFEEVRRKLVKGMSEDSYSIDMITTLMYRCPKNVFKAFDEMIIEKNKGAKDLRSHLLKITSEMNKSLVEIDKKIESIVT